MANLPKHPMCGSVTGEYLSNEDGSVQVPAFFMDAEKFQRIQSDLKTYKWNDSDFLLATFPKCGTHFMWETMMMLLKGSADYISASKTLLMVDACPVGMSNKVFPSPRVLNTHYRIDVLPGEFRKGKTVALMRNPKDTCVSYYYHYKNITMSMKDEPNPFENLTFAQFMELFLHDKDLPYGSYFDYIEYMWSLRDDPNILVVFYEDLKMNSIDTIQRLNEFMGTNRSPELVKEIADAVNFDKMKVGKTTGPPSKEMIAVMKTQSPNPEAILEKLRLGTLQIYRKGGIGDWKNHLTVAQNEHFDSFLKGWEAGKDIPFKYSQN
ncbi:sulfotransferase 1C2-like isoform X2 [Watersipora subatra]